MRLSSILSFVAATAALTLAYIPAAIADDGPTPATARAYARLVEKFDANKDGLVQVSELPTDLRDRLGAADADRDGTITPAELHAYGVAHRAARFARADKNGDGKLEASEVGPVKWDYIKVADANHDGFVTLAEIEAAVASGALTWPPRES